MGDIAIKVDHLSKEYRLGTIGYGTMREDMQSWWARIRGKDDPNSLVTDSYHSEMNKNHFLAIDDLNFEIKKGDRVGIIGRNGAGKSTLLKLLSRITSPTKGNIYIDGRIGSLLEVGTGFHPELTGRENIYLNGSILGMKKYEINRKLDEIVDFSGIEKFLDTPVKRYSSGMFVRLGFAVAAHLEPEILIVDEVLAVGDAEFQKKAIGKMEEVSKHDGRTILFVSHNMASVSQLCNLGILLSSGSLELHSDVSSAISAYLIKSNHMEKNEFSDEYRSGSGEVKIVGFSIEDNDGNEKQSILTGDNVFLVFKIEILNEIENINFGFSLHDEMGNTLSVLYSSYQNNLFDFNKDEIGNKREIRFFLKDNFICSRKVIVRTRIISDGNEVDWYKKPVGEFDIIRGDFFNTGKMGYAANVPFLLKGKWYKK